MASLFKVLWTQLDQTTSQDAAYGTSVDSNGNVLVAGYTNGNLSGNTNKGNSDGFVSKYSSSGTLLWTTTQGGAGYDASAAVGVDAQNNVYVLTGIDGYYWASHEPIGGAGASSILVSKYSPEGLLLNSVSITKDVAPRSISVSPSGDVLVTGSNGMWPRDYIAFLSHDYIASNGTSSSVFWEDTSIGGGSPASNAAGSIFLNNYFYITGCQNEDAFIAKYDLNGNQVWQNNIQASIRAETNAAVSDGLGSIYVTGLAGEIAGAGYHMPNVGTFGTDSFLAKYSESGTLLWIKEFGTSNDDAAQSIAMDSNGNIYVGGYTDRTFGATALDNTDSKPFINVFNKDGELLWSEVYTATTGDILGLSADNSGHVFAVGATDKNINDVIALESSGKNGLVMKLAYITGKDIADTIVGTIGNDIVYGLQGNDSLNGGNGNDELIGGVGNDSLNGGTGNDSFIGGDGTDTVSFGSDNSNIDLSQGTASGSSEGSDTITSVEVVDAGAGNDTVIGSASADTLLGGDGTDSLMGGDGNDSLSGGIGNDILLGGDGNDNVNAGSGSDLIVGGDGAGDDTYNGGEGVDTVKYTSAVAAITVNLALGTATSTAGSDASHIGTDTLSNIENIIAGDYADSLIGSDLNNAITGESGDDTINGGLGSDVAIYQGVKSQYTITNNNNGTWTVADSVSGRDGTDTVSNIEFLQFTDQTYSLLGPLLPLTGSANVDTLNGSYGDDTITGLAKVDILDGKEGSDLYVMTSSTDHTAAEITDTGSSGTDEVRFTSTSASTLTLYAGDTGIEKITIGTGSRASAITSGTAALNINAAALANGVIISGNAGNNILTGSLGYSDTLVGGLGNDTYVVNNTGDVITEDEGAGTDLIQSSISYTASTNVENLTLTGSSNINATGNALNNTLTGNNGNNTLDGGTGGDKMLGGGGNDTYIVDNASDAVTEVSNAGLDTIQTTLNTYSLAATLLANIENLTFNGSGNASLNGNALGNSITGYLGNDTINGGLGNDSLTGGSGNDTFIFNTRLNATTNKDIITDFSHADDSIQFSKAIMTGFVTIGALNANDFKVTSGVGIGTPFTGYSAFDTSDRIIYNKDSGALYYDVDGSGKTAAIQVALIGTTTHPTDIDHTDFMIIN